jgi:hypothetical protein
MTGQELEILVYCALCSTAHCSDFRLDRRRKKSKVAKPLVRCTVILSSTVHNSVIDADNGNMLHILMNS